MTAMKLPNIQILRACAAMMIVVYHCGIETARLSASAGGGRLFDEAPWGAGVPIFFAISGFIMVVTSARAFGSAAAAADFMRRRVIRIVPLYWLVTTLALGVALFAPSLSKAPPGDFLYVLASYLFWPYVRATGDVRPLATPGWTLNLEMLFYVVFAVSLLLRRGLGLSLLFASLTMLVAARVAGLLPGVALNFWGDPIVLGFLLGAAVGIAYNRGLRLSGFAALALMIVGFSVIFLSWVPSGAEDALGRRLAEAAPATLILIAFALGPQVEGRSLPLRGALAVGDASYSLYLIQEFLLRLMSLGWHKVLPSLVPLWIFIPVGIAAAVAAALASYRWFEKPVTRWLNGKAARRASPAATRLKASPLMRGTPAA